MYTYTHMYKYYTIIINIREKIIVVSLAGL